MTKKNTAVKEDATFLVKGEPVALKPYAPVDHTLYLPLIKIRDKEHVDIVAQKQPIGHVIFNRTLYLLAGESHVTVTSPNESVVHYLDDKSSEILYDAVVVLYHSRLHVYADTYIGGHNTLSFSRLTAHTYVRLTDANLADTVIDANIVTIANSDSKGCCLDSKQLSIQNSRCDAIMIATGEDISIKSSPYLQRFTIGGSEECKDERGLHSVSIMSPVLLQGDDNMIPHNFARHASGEGVKITIESRMDFSPITTINGKCFSTARSGDKGIIVGYLFIEQIHENVLLNNTDTEQLIEMLFGKIIPEKELSHSQKETLKDFIASIESRLNVYRAIDSNLN